MTTAKCPNAVLSFLAKYSLSGSQLFWFENGQKMSEVPFKDGKEEGPSVFYFDDGQLWGKGDFKNGEKGRIPGDA